MRHPILQVLLEIAGAWWVGWCLSQQKLSLLQSVVEAAVHHTRNALSVTRPGFFVYKQKFDPCLLGVIMKHLVQMCNNYIALPEAVRRSSPEGVLIMTNFGSIDSKFKNKDSYNNIKT
jgi:hypothetical protein